MTRTCHLDVLACPDCRGPLTALPEGPDVQWMECAPCELVFPVDDGIPILLPRTARCPALERPLIHHILEAGIRDAATAVRTQRYAARTLELLQSLGSRMAWEWEDEAFWSREYEQRFQTDENKLWNDRVREREFLVTRLAVAMDMRARVLLDVGCGESQNFRLLLAPHCDEETLYVAADMSLSGLRLNRRRNPHANSLYVLCSADRLPFRDAVMDVICYFGILHHCPRKEQTLAEDLRLLRDGGFMVIHEAVARPHLGSRMPFYAAGREPQSAHEERIDRMRLLRCLEIKPEVQIMARREFHTIFLSAAMRFCRHTLLARVWLLDLTLAVDRLLCRVLRWVLPPFKPGEIMLLVRKRGCSPRSGERTAHD